MCNAHISLLRFKNLIGCTYLINAFVVSETLTPKIPCVFLPNFAVFDIVGKINFSKNKSMQVQGSNRKILKLPCW
jgi:hypothetical protein